MRIVGACIIAVAVLGIIDMIWLKSESNNSSWMLNYEREIKQNHWTRKQIIDNCSGNKNVTITDFNGKLYLSIVELRGNLVLQKYADELEVTFDMHGKASNTKYSSIAASL